MATRPELNGVPNYYAWASEVVNRAERLRDGRVVFLDNKRAPLSEHTFYGLRYREPVNFQELNWQLDGASKWQQHLDQRYQIGDIHATTRILTGLESVLDLSIRLGGTWILVGQETIGSETFEYYRKTA